MKHKTRTPLFSSVYAPAVTEGTPNPSAERRLYGIARILGDFPNLANGERSAGIECLLTNGTVRRFRWDRLVTLSAG
jgi:hypothetical protein